MGTQTRQQIYGKTQITTSDLIQNNLKNTLKLLIKYMDTTETLTNKINIDMNQLSPRKYKRKRIRTEETQQDSYNNPKKQTKLTQYTLNS